MTSLLFKIAAVSWVIIFTERLVFWLWLWQLKEYHLGRFKAHFATNQGKRLIFNPLNLLQVILILGWILTFYFPSEGDLYYWPLIWLFILSAFLVFSALRVVLKIVFKRIKLPVLTKKIILLLFLGVVIEGLILGYLFSSDTEAIPLLLLVYFLSPLLFSFLVFLIQPLTILQQRRLLAKAKQKREKFKDLIVIGITGSYGKTSVKEFLYTILSEKFGEQVLKTKKHINAEIGIAQTILQELKPEHKIFIAEIGAYERGKIKQVCKVIKPKIGILTGIDEQHMATFGSQGNIVKAKFELIESLPEKGTAILNGDNNIIKNEKLRIKNYNSKLKIIKTVSTQAREGLWAENIRVEKESVSFKMLTQEGESADFKANLLGKHNIPNILLAAACAKELGMSLPEIVLACQKVKVLEGALRLVKGKDGLNILDATYSANPQGVVAHLEYLETAWREAGKTIIMPCLIELGKASKKVHYRIGEKIGRVCDLAIITTKDRFKELKQGAVKSGMSEDKIVFIENPTAILQKISASTNAGDVVLLESRINAKLKGSLIENP